MTTELKEKLIHDLERVLKEVEQSLTHLDQSLTYIAGTKVSLYGKIIRPTIKDRVVDIHNALIPVRRDLVHIPDDIKRFISQLANVETS